MVPSSMGSGPWAARDGGRGAGASVRLQWATGCVMWSTCSARDIRAESRGPRRRGSEGTRTCVLMWIHTLNPCNDVTGRRAVQVVESGFGCVSSGCGCTARIEPRQAQEQVAWVYERGPTLILPLLLTLVARGYRRVSITPALAAASGEGSAACMECKSHMSNESDGSGTWYVICTKRICTD